MGILIEEDFLLHNCKGWQFKVSLFKFISIWFLTLTKSFYNSVTNMSIPISSIDLNIWSPAVGALRDKYQSTWKKKKKTRWLRVRIIIISPALIQAQWSIFKSIGDNSRQPNLRSCQDWSSYWLDFVIFMFWYRACQRRNDWICRSSSSSRQL